MHVPEALIIAVAVLLVGAVAATVADRAGAPALLLFLGLGMLLGEDGPGGIHFEDAALVRDAGTVALALILVEGGVLADRGAVRRVLRPATALATVGVVVTAGIVGAAARAVLDVSWTSALLVGAVVSSTDAAAVFSAVRGVRLRRRPRSTLEAESGINDPFAALLVIALIEWQTVDGYGPADVALLLGLQAVVGAVGGVVTGHATALLLRRLPVVSAGLAPVLAISGALAGYVGVSALGGSGLLAAYLAGLILGDARIPHPGVVRGFLQGAAWLAQIGLFVLLGLLVTPSRLLDDGYAPVLIAAVLVLVARPAAVAACLTPLRWPVREQAFVAWAGLRGGVPIVFATFVVAGGVPGGVELFDVVFFVVVLSVIVQGATLRRAAALLGVIDHRPAPDVADLDVATLQRLGAELLEVRPEAIGVPVGRTIRDVSLPGGAVVVAIRRGDDVILPRGSTTLAGDDLLYLLVEQRNVPDVAARLAAVASRREADAQSP